MTVTAAVSATVDSSHRIATPRHYVMCPPTYFAVEYSINPWMDPSKPLDTGLAMKQWEHLKNVYEDLGHTVEVVEAQPTLPDMVFAANSGTVINGRVLGARFRAPQRAAEAEHFRRWFLAHGYRDVVMPARINEAEGDFAWTGSVLLAGSGFRSDRAAHDEAREVLGVPVVPLELVDPNYYHLDTALFVLERGARPSVAYYPDAFSAGSRKALQRLFPDAVLASADDAACLGLNGVSDGKHVVLAQEATGLVEQLTWRGYQPIPVDISELRKSGGGPKCCTMEIHSTPA